MVRYLLRRILLALPTLLVLSLITFGLSKCSPIDPVEKLYGDGSGTIRTTPAQRANSYRTKAGWIGLDRPAFYFTFTSALFPDTLSRVFPPDRRERLKRLALEKGSWTLAQEYEQALWAAMAAAARLPDTFPERIYLTSELNKLESAATAARIAAGMTLIDSLAGTGRADAAWTSAHARLHDRAWALVKAVPRWSDVYRPALYWNGADNQYHRWLVNFLRGDLGLSYGYRRPVWEELRPVMASTLLLSGAVVVLAYALSIPMGVFLARRRYRRSDRWGQRGLLFLHAMPAFWTGSLLILLFATPGLGLQWIHGISIDPWENSGKTLLQWAWGNRVKFILPVATLTLHALAVLSLQMRGGMLDALGQDYIRTARAKGLDENAVHWRHAFRNALFPLITIFASVLPALFAGSIVIEYLFNFPGMGSKTHQAFLSNDPPVLLAIFMLGSVLTVLGSLAADLLYAVADPRVRFTGKR
jgi:peptide/nickel transport system permease protein